MEERLHEHFNRVMKSDNVPLFKSFDVYRRSLPVRRNQASGRQLPLYTLAHWACEDDIASMANQLERTTKERALVKYLAAPGASGKTSSVLPAFLRSAERGGGFTHYIYLAFANNGYNFYQLSPDGNEIMSLALALHQWRLIYFKLLEASFRRAARHEWPTYVPM